jgi:glutaredoxin
MYGIIVIANAPCGVTYVTKAKEPAPFQVTFYTKAECHLCEEARDMLEDIAALTTYELTEIDIRGNPDIFEKYRYRIPVIIINDETLIEGRIEFRDLAKAFHLR